EFDWSLRNNTTYGETGVLTALQYTSTFSKIILENFYQKSRNSIDAARKDAVAGYVIPAGQRDPTRVTVLVNLLRMQGIEVGRATAEVKLKEGTFPAGSFIVKRDQPYGRLAKILLEKQVYPDPSLRTYDDTAWTMGLMSQAEVKEVQDKAVLDVKTAAVNECHPAGAVAGTWGSTQDVGWGRYAFDKFGVPYDLIYKERVRKGDLKSSYDVIVVPNIAGATSAKRLVLDIESRGTPIEYKNSEKFRNLGVYGESDDITGGMGLDGASEIDKFVKAGGVLLTLGTASYFPAEYGIAPRIDAARTSPQFYAPGPIVEAEILRPEHPIFYGYEKKSVPVRYANGPLLT